jgi:hypothetical protein
MDRDDTGMFDRSDEARQGDTGMIGSESEDPGPGRDTSLTEPDPVADSADQPQGTVAMSEGDPIRTRLGSHVEGAGVIGYDVAASEEGPTDAERDAGVAEPVVDREAYERDPGMPGEPAVDQGSYDPGLATEPVVDQDAYARDAGAAPVQEPVTYGEEEGLTRRPEDPDHPSNR